MLALFPVCEFCKLGMKTGREKRCDPDRFVPPFRMAVDPVDGTAENDF
jgi:hypothetical protein